MTTSTDRKAKPRGPFRVYTPASIGDAIATTGRRQV